MKKNLFNRIFAVVLVLVMLSTSFISASALSFNAPGDASTTDDLYSIAFEDGVLSVKVNPDRIYDMLKDRDLTREELLELIPADILDTLSKGKELTRDDLTELISNYITVDDLKAMVDNLPVDIVKKYFSYDMITDIVSVKEIIDLLPIDEVLAEIDAEDFEMLLNDEVKELVFNEKLEDKLIDGGIVDDLINETTIVDDVFADEVLKGKLFDLVDDQIINSIMADAENKAALMKLAESDKVVDRMINNTAALNTLANYLTSDANDAAFQLFVDDEKVANTLIGIEAIKNYLVSEDALMALVDANVVNRTNVQSILTNDQINGLVTDEIIEEQLADEDVLNSFFNDPDFVAKEVTVSFELEMISRGYVTLMPGYTLDDVVEATKVAVATNDEARAFVAHDIRTNSNITVEDYLDHVDFAEFARASQTEIKNVIEGDAETYDRLVDNVSTGAIIDAIGDDCETLVKNNAKEIVSKVGASKVFYYFSLDGAVEALGGYDQIVSDGFVTVEEVSDAMGGYSELIEYFDTDTLINTIGMDTILEYVDIEDAVNKVGGYRALAELYTNDELTAIVKAIGPDGIRKFINESGVLDAIDVKAIAGDFIDYAKSKVPEVKALVKTVARQTLTILLTEVEGIYINDGIIYEAGKFDLNKMIVETLQAIPDVKTFTSLKEGDNFAEYIISAVIAGEKYQFGVAFGFLGDPSNLQSLLVRLEDNFIIDVSDDGNIDVTVGTPAVVSAIYEKVLESGRVPAALKAKLVNMPNYSLDDLRDAIAEISEEDIASVANAVEEKADEIKDKAYAIAEKKILSLYDKVESKADAKGGKVEFFVDKAGNIVTKDRVEALIDASKKVVDKAIDVATDPAKLSAAKDRVVAGFNKLPDKLTTTALIDLYRGNGGFSANVGKSFDIFEVINNRVSLPEEIKVMFKSTVISLSANLDLTVADLYKLEVMLADGSVYTTLLPAGTSLDVLNNLSGIDLSSGIVNGETEYVTEMPAEDLMLYSDDLYSVKFVANNETVKTVFYPYGTETIDVPAIPESAQKEGYTAAWEEFSLNTVKRLVVGVAYTEITDPDDPDDPDDETFKATFIADGKTVKEITFTKDTTFAEFQTKVPAVPAKAGYTGSWEPYEAKFKEYKDFTVNAIYVKDQTPPGGPETFKATFIADGKTVKVVTFTKDTTFAEFQAQVPAVPTKAGYNGAWEAYEAKFNERKDFTVNAVYTAIEYEATFKADGVVVGVVKFTVEDTEIVAPAVPAKLGYAGVWEKYEIVPANITINAIYTANIYTATFIADDVVVGTVNFTIEDKSIPEPEVPKKEGYIGVWESYSLGAADVTIHAIYTLEEGDGSFWWWLLILFAVIIIAIIILFLVKSNKKDDDVPPETPEVVEPEPEPEIIPEPEPVIIPEPVEDVAAEEVDELMTDDAALAAVVVEEATSAPVQGPKAVVNTSAISEAFEDGDTVSLETLKAKKLVPAKTARVKILANGHLNKHNLTVEANSFSVQAIKMIQLTGGTVIQKK